MKKAGIELKDVVKRATGQWCVLWDGSLGELGQGVHGGDLEFKCYTPKVCRRNLEKKINSQIQSDPVRLRLRLSLVAVGSRFFGCGILLLRAEAEAFLKENSNALPQDLGIPDTSGILGILGATVSALRGLRWTKDLVLTIVWWCPIKRNIVVLCCLLTLWVHMGPFIIY